MARLVLDRPEFFDIFQIFDCGQCFRFDPDPSTGEGCFSGVAFGRFVTVSQTDDKIIISGADEKDRSLWEDFFALDEDYAGIRNDIISRFNGDETIGKALEYGSGIRILRQDPWEAVCSFIISQNNNIPRIKKIIYALSKEFGEPVLSGVNTYYSFPTAKALFEAGEEKIFALKTGFRAKYIHCAAKMVCEGELDLDKIASLDTAEALSELMKVKGIGLKVASCAALFGFHKTDAFPVDVWMKKVEAKYYPKGLDIPSLGRYAGIAQQYLFYYERYNGAKEE